MKALYLRDENYNWVSYNYENLEDLKEEFLSRKISIGDNCTLGDNCKLGNRAMVSSETKLISGIYLNGSKHSVTYVGNNSISIGCYTHTIEEWKANSKRIGSDGGYSSEQINEYEKYILLVEQFAKN